MVHRHFDSKTLLFPFQSTKCKSLAHQWTMLWKAVLHLVMNCIPSLDRDLLDSRFWHLRGNMLSTCCSVPCKHHPTVCFTVTGRPCHLVHPDVYWPHYTPETAAWAPSSYLRQPDFPIKPFPTVTEAAAFLRDATVQIFSQNLHPFSKRKKKKKFWFPFPSGKWHLCIFLLVINKVSSHRSSLFDLLYFFFFGYVPLLWFVQHSISNATV